MILLGMYEGAILDGIYMYHPLSDLEDICLYGLVGIIGATIGRKTVYKSISYRLVSCFIVAVLFAIFDVFLRIGVNDTILRIHMPAVLGVSIVGALFTYYIRPFVARRALKN